MSMAEAWASIGLAIIGWAAVAIIARRARASDYRMGAQAYRDGLPLNARWGKDMRHGWADAMMAKLYAETRIQR